MPALLPQIRGVFLSNCIICQHIKEWYTASRQWLMGLLTGVQLDINTLRMGFLIVVGLLLLMLLIQALSHRSKRKNWLAIRPLIDGAVEASDDLILMVSPDGDIQYANPAAEAVFGIQEKEPGNLLDTVSETADIKQGTVSRLWEAAVSRMYHKPQSHDFGEDFLFGKELYQGRITPVMRKKSDTIQALIVVFSRKSVSVKQEIQSPDIDSVTGLLNYTGFMAQLEARMSVAKTGIEPFCCSVLQVENLDMLTLEKGFAIHNELMNQLARRIVSTLPEEWAIGRIADDRFALASPLERTREECAATVAKVTRQLGQHLILDAQYIEPLIRIGTANSDIADTAQALLDTALATSAGLTAAARAPVMDTVPAAPQAQEPEPAMEPESSLEDAPSLAVDMAPGIEAQTVKLYYQPQVYLKDGYLRGFHVNAVYDTVPDGRLEGDVLYGRIEAKGLIPPFIKALLVKAMKAARQWHALYAKRIIVMCTLPPTWLSEPELSDIVREALSESTLAADYVELFIPYTKQKPWTPGDNGAIEELKTLGVRVAASGLESGALPLDAAVSPHYNTLVMTRSLIVHAGESEKYRTLAGNVVQLGRKAGKDILAMGINGHNDLRMLRQKECPYGQGMMIGGPVTEENLAQILIDGIDLPS